MIDKEDREQTVDNWIGGYRACYVFLTNTSSPDQFNYKIVLG